MHQKAFDKYCSKVAVRATRRLVLYVVKRAATTHRNIVSSLQYGRESPRIQRIVVNPVFSPEWTVIAFVFAIIVCSLVYTKQGEPQN